MADGPYNPREEANKKPAEAPVQGPSRAPIQGPLKGFGTPKDITGVADYAKYSPPEPDKKVTAFDKKVEAVDKKQPPASTKNKKDNPAAESNSSNSVNKSDNPAGDPASAQDPNTRMLSQTSTKELKDKAVDVVVNGQSELSDIFTNKIKPEWAKETYGRIPGSKTGKPDGNAYFDDLSDDIQELTRPILKIKPSTLKLTSSKSDQAFNIEHVINEFFKFEVSPINTNIGYSHSNTYSQSNIEGNFKSLATTMPINELMQLAHAGSGAFGKTIGGIASGVSGVTSQAINALGGAAKQISAEQGMPDLNNMIGLGMDTISAIAQGARIDLPNIWQDSSTNLTFTFEINLYTYANKAEDELYQKEILRPLMILFALSLPVAGKSISYLEPPYVTLEFGRVCTMKIGGVSNISINFPTNEWNFGMYPRHVQVSISVTNLYSTLLQSSDASKVENKDLPLMDHIIDMLKAPGPSPLDKQGAILLAEEWLGEGSSGKEFANVGKTSPFNLSDYAGADFSADPFVPFELGSERLPLLSDAFGEGIGGLEGLGNVDLSLLGDKLTTALPALGGASLGDFKNLTNLTGNLLNDGLLKGLTQSLKLPNLNTLIGGVTNLATGQINSVLNGVTSGLTGSLNKALGPLTKGLMNVVPTNLLNQLGSATNGIIKDAMNSFPMGLNLNPVLNLVNSATKIIPNNLNNILNQIPTSVDKIQSDIIGSLTKSNPVLKELIKTDNSLKGLLNNVSESVTIMVNKPEFREANKAIAAVANSQDELKKLSSNLYNFVGDVSKTMTIAETFGQKLDNNFKDRKLSLNIDDITKV